VKKIANSNNIKKENFTGKNQQVFSPSFSQNYVPNKFFLKIGTNCPVGFTLLYPSESID
jgi:hypothetical protein